MTRKREDKNTRYFIDLDLKTQRILDWGYDQKEKLAIQELDNTFYQRVFITKGQYNKLEKKNQEINKKDVKKR